MTTKTDFSASDLFDAATGALDPETFLQEDGTYVVPTPVYLNREGGEADYYWSAAKDDRGFKIISRVENKVYEDSSEVEDELADNEFLYEGGYLPGFGLFKMLDNGNLGDGHDAWALVEHESGRLFRFGGWYSSWDSSGWEECVEVVPAEVKVVRYADKNNLEKVFDNPAVTV